MKKFTDDAIQPMSYREVIWAFYTLSFIDLTLYYLVRQTPPDGTLYLLNLMNSSFLNLDINFCDKHPHLNQNLILKWIFDWQDYFLTLLYSNKHQLKVAIFMLRKIHTLEINSINKNFSHLTVINEWLMSTK